MDRPGIPTRLEVAQFTRQLAVLFNAGIDLPSALEALQRGAGRPAMGELCLGLQRQILLGKPFSLATSQYPEAFPMVFSAVLRVSEEVGALGASLHRLANWLEQDVLRWRRLMAHLTYPTMVLALTTLLTLAFFGWVLPMLFTFLPGSEGLPLLTRILVKVVGLLHSPVTWVVGLVFAVEIFQGGRRLRNQPELAVSFCLRLPVLGPLMARSCLTRFCASMAALLTAGAPLIRSLKLAGESSGNPLLQVEVTRVIQAIEQGQVLSDQLRASPHFPRLVSELVACGEESGNLSLMMDYLEKFYAAEVQDRLELLGALLEPLLLSLVAGVVALVLVGVFVPLYLSLGDVAH